MKTVSAVLALLVVVSSVAFIGCQSTQGASQAASPQMAGKPQTTCPVTGAPINKNIYTDYKGKRIYFCCEGCREAFKKDPDKYMKVLADQGVTPENAPAESTSSAMPEPATPSGK